MGTGGKPGEHGCGNLPVEVAKNMIKCECLSAIIFIQLLLNLSAFLGLAKQVLQRLFIVSVIKTNQIIRM